MAAWERRREPWQREQRYYCATCNVWMGSDRHSILLHENGKKHRENVERAMEGRRNKKQRVEEAQKFLSDSLKQMERAALAETGGKGDVHNRTIKPGSVAPSHLSSNRVKNMHAHNDQTHYNHRQPPQGTNFSIGRGDISQFSVMNSSPHARAPHIVNPLNHSNNRLVSNHQTRSQLEQERIDWQTQKIKREEINTNKRKDRGGDDNGQDEDTIQSFTTHSKVTIRPGEGYYSYDDADENNIKNGTGEGEKKEPIELKSAIYLEGSVFFGLLEAEMPVQVWTGSSSCRIEKRRIANVSSWKNALILRVVSNHFDSTRGQSNAQLPLVDVSYLTSVDDREETIERKIFVDRIRIKLGDDEKIPDSLEEARLLAMGGEEVHFTSTSNLKQENSNDQQHELDVTGLSGWQTVSIKRTTHRQEHKEARRRFEERKLDASKKREAEQEQIAMRRLEESRAASADDSALGAFDVYGKMSYKGVDISKEATYSVEDSVKRLGTIKNLAPGVKVAFKKKMRKKVQKAARRRTLGNDDD